METRYRCNSCNVVSEGRSLLGVDPDRRRRGHGVWNAALQRRPSCPFCDGTVTAVMTKVFLRSSAGQFRAASG